MNPDEEGPERPDDVASLFPEDEYSHPPEEQTCAACGRPMKPRMNGALWHMRCGTEGGME